MNLYRWQSDALASWTNAGRRGIVEAVTGTGKTIVGMAAIAEAAKSDGYGFLHPLVVVPSTVLMNQWYDRAHTFLPGAKIGRISNDYEDDFSRKDICIGIINSIVSRLPDLFAHTARNPARYRTLLIADECHHYIDAPVFSRLLRYPFHFTLGLSATVRPAIPYEVKGLGRIIYEYTFDQAGEDGLVPPFDLVNCATHFTPNEERQYLDLTDKISDQFEKVFDLFRDDLRNIPDEYLFRKLRQLMMIDAETEDPNIKRLFILLFKRAALCYQATNKLALALGLILLMLKQRKKVLVYFERIDSTEEVADIALQTSCRLKNQVLATGDAWCKVYHSQLSDADRIQVLEDFRQPGPKALLSCRTLDEGLDIPEVDCAILAASTQSRRQRIQRIGRVLRKGDGNKRSTVVTLFVKGSGDENVCADDHEVFGGPVSLHNTHDRECLKFVDDLIQNGGPTTPPTVQ